MDLLVALRDLVHTRAIAHASLDVSDEGLVHMWLSPRIGGEDGPWLSVAARPDGLWHVTDHGNCDWGREEHLGAAQSPEGLLKEGAVAWPRWVRLDRL